ncbi:carboxylesterase [Sparassis crispa]|uniref:Carboxylic ester hydrolase n=1 Tax=Sparassis crispa TaxID=139825 RepID=A0A401H3V6_9APHY|nr:carboxylesterase [Sparassis crispa]GBE89117.1 carboxylesterase [Sparassis crispa]
MIAKVLNSVEEPVVLHEELQTTFSGVVHSISTPDAAVHQYRGIKYASIPARFRQSRLFTTYPPQTDATRFGPICPQPRYKTVEEELFGIADDSIPQQHLKQSEADCLNLNITCPADATPDSHLPVMLWTHGGGCRGSGSSWIFDGGSLVQKSIQIGKPVIVVTFNYRLGLLGCAASLALREDNRVAGDDGVGNYGLRDQRRAHQWVYCFISEFGGNPLNITLFGESSGAADILCHLHSAANDTHPLFRRAIIQSAQTDFEVPNLHAAGSQLSKIMSALRVHTLEELRAVDPEKLVSLSTTMRAVDDGTFFRQGFAGFLVPLESDEYHHLSEEQLARHSPELIPHSNPLKTAHRLLHQFSQPYKDSRSRSHSHHRHPLQPIMIGDCGDESLLWSLTASLWTASGVVRRVRAVCQSLTKANALLRAYDINAYTPVDELPQRVLELINDSRFAWPTECIAASHKRERGGRGVWRYVFDQEGPARGVPHHAVDLIYLFDNVPLPSVVPTVSGDGCPTDSGPECFFSSDSEAEDSGSDYAYGDSSESGSIEEWAMPVVDDWTYSRVRDAVQERWIAFAYGEAPWQEEKVYVFGPEGEIGERSRSIFDGRRRTQLWRDALEPLGMHLVQKLGTELSNGPPCPARI